MKSFAFKDRSTWRKDSPAFSEWADKVLWVDRETGLDCMLHRNNFGSWCGYVGVPQSHALHSLTYQDFWDLDVNLSVHGGITYTEGCDGLRDDGSGICHIADDGDHVWWIGFDTAHLCDVMPSGLVSSSGTYRTQAFSTGEVTLLARQISNIK